jgi:hypothetical protein
LSDLAAKLPEIIRPVGYTKKNASGACTAANPLAQRSWRILNAHHDTADDLRGFFPALRRYPLRHLRTANEAVSSAGTISIATELTLNRSSN